MASQAWGFRIAGAAPFCRGSGLNRLPSPLHSSLSVGSSFATFFARLNSRHLRSVGQSRLLKCGCANLILSPYPEPYLSRGLILPRRLRLDGDPFPAPFRDGVLSIPLLHSQSRGCSHSISPIYHCGNLPLPAVFRREVLNVSLVTSRQNLRTSLRSF